MTRSQHDPTTYHLVTGDAKQSSPPQEPLFEPDELRLYERGERLFRRSFFQRALQVWIPLLRKETLRPEARELLSRRIAETHYRRGTIRARARRQKAHNLRLAMRHFHAAVDLQPDNATYVLALARAAERVAPPQAVTAYRRYLELKDDEGVRRHLCEFLIRQGMFDEALHEVRKATSLPSVNESDDTWRRLEVLALAGTKNWVVVVQRLTTPYRDVQLWLADVEQVIRSQTPSPELLQSVEKMAAQAQDSGNAGMERLSLLLGDMSAELGRYPEAVAHWERAFGGRAKIPTLKLVPVLEQLGFEASSRGDLKSAIEYWTEVQNIGWEPERILANIATAKAEAAYRSWQEGDREDAVRGWQESLRILLNPAVAMNLAYAYENLGRYAEANEAWAVWLGSADEASESERNAVRRRRLINLLRENRVPEAIKECLRVRQTTPDSPDLAVVLGYLLLHSQRPDEAARVFREVVQQRPDDLAAREGLAVALEQNGNLVGAAEAWQHLAQANPEANRHAFEHFRRLVLKLGIEAWNTHRPEIAMQHFANLLMVNPGDVDAWLWCGTLHMHLGHESSGEDCLAQALEIRPDDPILRVRVGGRYLAAGKREKATAAFNAARELRDDPEIDLHIGHEFSEVGEKDVAAKYYRSALTRAKRGSAVGTQALRALLRITPANEWLPLLEHARGVLKDPLRVDLLLAVEKIQWHEWKAAQQHLDELAEKAIDSGDTAVQQDIEFFRRSLILMRTVGIDQTVISRYRDEMLQRWHQEFDRNEPEATEPTPEIPSIERLISEWLQPEEKEPLPIAVAYRRPPRREQPFFEQRAFDPQRAVSRR